MKQFGLNLIRIKWIWNLALLIRCWCTFLLNLRCELFYFILIMNMIWPLIVDRFHELCFLTYKHGRASESTVLNGSDNPVISTCIASQCASINRSYLDVKTEKKHQHTCFNLKTVYLSERRRLEEIIAFNRNKSDQHIEKWQHLYQFCFF